MKYHEQLRHPLWQKKRLEILEFYDFMCQKCGSKNNTLNVHHKFYKRGAMIWEYQINELKCLCEKCHKDEHAIDEKIRVLINSCDVSKEEILEYLKSKQDAFIKAHKCPF